MLYLMIVLSIKLPISDCNFLCVCVWAIVRCVLFNSNRMPFDVSTLSMGYITAYAIQLSGSAIICAIIYTINSLFFGICWYIRVLLLDLQQTFSRGNMLYRNDERSMEHKTYDAKRPAKRTNNNKIKRFQSNRTAIRLFDNLTDRTELTHIYQVTKLIKKFVEDHNDILR